MMLRVALLLLTCLVPTSGYASQIFYWSAESATLDATRDYNPNNSTETASTTGTPAINGTAALVGSNGIQITGSGFAAEYYSFESASTNVNAAAGTIGFYVRIQTFTDAAALVRLRTNSGAANDNVTVYLSTATNNHIRLSIRNSGSGTVSFDCSTALSNDTTYYVIVGWDRSVNDRRCEIYDSGGAPVGSNEDLTTSWTTPATGYPVTNGLIVGDIAGANAAYYLDNLNLYDTYADIATAYTDRNRTSYWGAVSCRGALSLMGVGGC